MEKSMKFSAGELDATVMEEASTPTKASKFSGLQKLGKLLGVEVQGNDPIALGEKKDRRYFKLFTLWFSMNFNLLAYVYPSQHAPVAEFQVKSHQTNH